jgi:hypothetical protein
MAKCSARGRGWTVVIKVLCAASLLLSASALRADTFNFTYTGVTGTVTATLVNPLTPGIYNITNVRGIDNNVSFNSSLPGGTLTYNASGSTGVMMFVVGGALDTVTFANGTYVDSLSGTASTRGFSLTPAVAEPTAILLLLIMGLGVWLLARKLHFQPRAVVPIDRL